MRKCTEREKSVQTARVPVLACMDGPAASRVPELSPYITPYLGVS